MTLKGNGSSTGRIPGSPNTGEPEFLVIGKLRRPHGVRGEMLMSVLTDFPEWLQPGVQVYCGEDHNPISIRSVRWHREDMLIAFEEYADREKVGALRNQLLHVRAEEIPVLEEGEYYQHQILGLRVIRDEDDLVIGTVEKIIETGSNDVLLVRGENEDEILIPDIRSVVLHIDIKQGEMRVHLPPGLLSP